MTLSNNDVEHIAKLARLRLTAEELPHYASEINGLLKWIEQLSEVDTTGVAPMLSVSDQLLPWRKDVVNDGHQRDAVLKNAPMQNYGCFAVPKVLD